MVWRRSKDCLHRNFASVVQFGALTEEVVKTVVDKFLAQLQGQLDEKKIFLKVDDDAKAWLAERGYDAKMGARPMDRLIQERIRKPLAEEVLFGALSDNGGVVDVGVKDDELVIETAPHD